MTLGDRFLDAATTSIDHDGRTIHSVVAIDLGGRSTVSVLRTAHRRDRVQTLNVRVDKGELQVNGVYAPSLCLRSDTAPDAVTILATTADQATLHLWNGWIADGTHHAWIGNAGIDHERDGERHTLRCSDGIGRPTFDDLVVVLRIGTP